MFKVGDIVRAVATPADGKELKGKVGKVIEVYGKGIKVRWVDWECGHGDGENEWWVSDDILQFLYREEDDEVDLLEIGTHVQIVNEPVDLDGGTVGLYAYIIDVDSDNADMPYLIRVPYWGKGHGEDENEWWVAANTIKEAAWPEQLVEAVYRDVPAKLEAEENDEDFDADVASGQKAYVSFSCSDPKDGHTNIGGHILTDAHITEHLALFKRYLLGVGYTWVGSVNVTAVGEDEICHSSEDC